MQTVAISTFFIAAPFVLIALALPKWLPKMLQITIGIPIKNIIFPAKTNEINAPIFEAKFKTFAVPEACRIEILLIRQRQIIKTLPVPGPKKPS
jgi:hypothetical protein